MMENVIAFETERERETEREVLLPNLQIHE